MEFQLRKVQLAGRPTSIRLESSTWEAVSEVAARERKTVDDLLTLADAASTASTRIGRVHVFLLDYYRRELLEC